MYRPLVSVIIPIYNAAPYLKEAIESITNQTYKNLEIILVDDCSTDNSFEIAESFKDERIKLYKNQKNLKISKTLNFAISKTKGEYIARMDADDISDLTRIEKQISFLENHQDIDFCGTAIRFFGEIEQDLFYKENITDIRDEILQGTPFGHATTIFRSKIKKELIYIDEYSGKEDLALFSTLLINGHNGYNLNELLYKYRITGNQTVFKKSGEKITFNKSKKEIGYNILKCNLRHCYNVGFQYPNLENYERMLLDDYKLQNVEEIVKLSGYVNYLNKHSNNFYSKNAFNKLFILKLKVFLNEKRYNLEKFSLFFNRNIISILFKYFTQ